MGSAVRKNEVEEPEDQDWIFSYADLMSLLLCFFILLFAISVIDPNKAKKVSERLKAAFEGVDSTVVPEVQVFDRPTERQARAFQLLVKMLNINDTPEQIVGVIEDVHAKRTSFSDVAKMIDPERKEEVLKEINHKQKKIVLVLPTDIYFQSNSDFLNSSGKKNIRAMLPALREVSGLAKIQIIGYSDGARARAKGRRQSWQLASNRALTVAQLLIRGGIPEKSILVSSAGAARPVVSESKLEGRALKIARSQNRRVEILLLKE